MVSSAGSDQSHNQFILCVEGEEGFKKMSFDLRSWLVN